MLAEKEDEEEKGDKMRKCRKHKNTNWDQKLTHKSPPKKLFL